uniref:Uncharacterized protein n=1 Tax=viral metagenome TaxID=1070528 RepID=A0A6C0ECU6_9ZZZZ
MHFIHHLYIYNIKKYYNIFFYNIFEIINGPI